MGRSLPPPHPLLPGCRGWFSITPEMVEGLSLGKGSEEMTVTVLANQTMFHYREQEQKEKRNSDSSTGHCSSKNPAKALPNCPPPPHWLIIVLQVEFSEMLDTEQEILLLQLEISDRKLGNHWDLDRPE